MPDRETPDERNSAAGLVEVPAPYALVAEVTHRCPLRCPYCSNPLELIRRGQELCTDEWLRVLSEARSLGVVQVSFSGGEPLMREDLEILVSRARELDFYTNLITSGVGLTQERIGSLASRGLDSVQLSLQAADPTLADRIAGRKSYEEKRQAAEFIKAADLPLNINVVLHRQNLDEIERIIDLCLSWGAERLELANTQYYGWAVANRASLLPSRRQLLTAEAICKRKRAVIGERMEIIWVVADYYERMPKPCMGGWGRVQLTITPNGYVLPCPAATTIASLEFETVRAHHLSWIWSESPSFNCFRGYDWMEEPCRSCDRRFEDFGGCRCQAFALTGEAARPDPVCQWAPDRSLIERVISSSSEMSINSSEQERAKPASALSYRKYPETLDLNLR